MFHRSLLQGEGWRWQTSRGKPQRTKAGNSGGRWCSQWARRRAASWARTIVTENRPNIPQERQNWPLRRSAKGRPRNMAPTVFFKCCTVPTRQNQPMVLPSLIAVSPRPRVLHYQAINPPPDNRPSSIRSNSIPPVFRHARVFGLGAMLHACVGMRNPTANMATQAWAMAPELLSVMDG